MMMTTTNAGTPKTTRRALALALASTVTSMGVVVAPPARAKFSIFDDDDDPFARERAASSFWIGEATARARRGDVSKARGDDGGDGGGDDDGRGGVDARGGEAVVAAAAAGGTTRASTKVDTKQLLNNQRIKTYNNAPADFPAFIREGYDVRVVHGNDYVVREDGLIVKDYEVERAKPIIKSARSSTSRTTKTAARSIVRIVEASRRRRGWGSTA